MKVHKTIRVIGKVQGVFFRAETNELAKKLKLTGYVKNEVDGTVVMEIEGKKDDVKQLIEWCKKGTSKSEVTRCEVHDGELKQYASFEIRR